MKTRRYTKGCLSYGCVQAGLKTGMYYLRTRAAADAIKFTVDQQALAKRKAARGVTASAAKTEVLKVTPTAVQQDLSCS